MWQPLCKGHPGTRLARRKRAKEVPQLPVLPQSAGANHWCYLLDCDLILETGLQSLNQSRTKLSTGN